MADQDTSAPQARRTCVGNRICTILSATLWPLAIAVWLLFLGGAIRSQNLTTAAFMWLMALGSWGAPALGLRILGPFATERALRYTAGAGAGGGLILTVEYLTGDLRPGIVSLYATLMLPMAIGLRAYGAVADLRRRAQVAARIEDAHREGLRDGRAQEARAVEEYDQAAMRRLHERTDDELEHFLDELGQFIRAGRLILKARRDEANQPPCAPVLTVVREDAYRRRSG